jgi:toxin FitB
VRALLDTNVVSELVKENADQNVIAACNALTGPLVSSITFHELSYGISRMPMGARKLELTGWLNLLRADYAGRTIDVTANVAEAAGRIRAESVMRKRNMTISDSLIAASALLNGAILYTRNIKDFKDADIECVNPWTL